MCDMEVFIVSKEYDYELSPLFDVPDDVVLHIEDIADLIGMHSESVRRWCRDGKMASYCFGNKYIITGLDFKAFMKASRVKPKWARE
jgi:excisionase family DNA binding protein